MPRPSPSKVAAALQYLQQMRDRAADFGGGVVDTLGNRARDVGGLAYEALTSDPNISRMNTAEFSQAAADRPSTPRLDAAVQGIGEMGKALVTQPVQTAKAIVVDPVVNAFESPRAMGQFAGEFVNPLRIAAALRKTAPIAELDVYHGTPHRFPGTEENPLGEFDASKIGTGEGAQAYGHGVYLAESPKVARGYATQIPYRNFEKKVSQVYSEFDSPDDAMEALKDAGLSSQELLVVQALQDDDFLGFDYPHQALRAALKEPENYDLSLETKSAIQNLSSLYKADLPDEMIDRMLDWDKPLSEQPAVLAVVKNLPEVKTLTERGQKFENLTGQNFYKLISDSRSHGYRDASSGFKSAGIPGIKYADAGSRGNKGDGTRNFVVFPGEEKKVKILKRD